MASAKICFNSYCNAPKSEPARRKGWKLRSGDHAELCDGCFHVYENGKFCETFHSSSDGWRKCEQCPKRVHCGCIVSFPTFVLVDTGGIQCVDCTRKNFLAVPSQMWSPSVPQVPQPQLLERSIEYPVKNLNQGTSSFPGQRRQPSNLWNAGGPQSDLQQRLSFELDRIPNAEKLISASRFTGSPQNRRTADPPERQVSSNRNNFLRDRHRNGAPDSITTSSPLSNAQKHGNAPSDKGETQMAPPLQKQISPNLNNGSDSSVKSQHDRYRAEARVRAETNSRYWPQMADQELQKIPGGSNVAITYLFEKQLSASDVGKIGRLVLPKKFAETFFPAISQPEGFPLKVQDVAGKEWAFQYRFWPNNNSRMYVLEGVTACIQSMQLQAGDTVIFSRIDAEDKLVMGFRKASIEQEVQASKTGNGLSTHPEVNKSIIDASANGATQPQIVSIDSESADSAGEHSNLSKRDKIGTRQKDESTSKPSDGRKKRKRRGFSCKNKRLQVENEEIKVEVTWEEAQEHLRPSPNEVLKVIIFEGMELEEYKEPPVVGLATVYTENPSGEENQWTRWARCEDCLKLRKLPTDARLPARWTCSDNIWDTERSSCSLDQEVSAELREMLPAKTVGRKPRAKVEQTNGTEASDTPDSLPMLENGDSVPGTTQPHSSGGHPRHKVGCRCIVCIQKSGRGHGPNCRCDDCELYTNFKKARKQRQSQRQAAAAEARKSQLEEEPKEMTSVPPPGTDPPPSSSNAAANRDGAVDDELKKPRVSFDLNFQPDPTD